MFVFGVVEVVEFICLFVVIDVVDIVIMGEGFYDG